MPSSIDARATISREPCSLPRAAAADAAACIRLKSEVFSAAMASARSMRGSEVPAVLCSDSTVASASFGAPAAFCATANRIPYSRSSGKNRNSVS